ncbi:NADH-quinone oxidoreductase subunit NuoG [Acetobacteraceae bacterium]|nr:NADH-quinone oxidoreductase subunit NuoG [Acetobacteraceae bacterium]
MATIYVDGKEYEVNGADNLLQACLSLGLNIPYFCWHPALGSVGSCRQCAVKQYQNADDKRGRLVMSCMAPATDGTMISIEDDEAKEFRQSVVEWLMTNHPHDCPVCAEGGNCHLQDMTVMTGHNKRRFRFLKRTHQNQNLGPFVAHEMNRCIACYRCVRYYKDYADGTDLGVFGAHNNVYFGRIEDGTLESEFSGNLTEVCPTGVFTDKTHTERYNRKWDMQFAPSICQQCSVGCNISPGERYGELRRIENRYNGTVNHYFLCDRGRFGYGYVNLENRPKHPMRRHAEENKKLDAQEAIAEAAAFLRQAKKTIAIGSPRASIESNTTLRNLVGADNFYTGLATDELERLNLALKILQESGIYTPSLREIESYDTVLILGEDITQTGARIALAVRQALKQKAKEMSCGGQCPTPAEMAKMTERERAAASPLENWQVAALQNIAQGSRFPLFITSTDKTRLDDAAAATYHAPAEDQARLAFAIAHKIDPQAPAVEDLPPDCQRKVDDIVNALREARKPLIISGTQAGGTAILQSAANIAKALKEQGSEVGLTLVADEVNSIGLAMIGGGSLDQALSALKNGSADNVIILENDLYRHASVKDVDAALEKAASVIVLDHLQTKIMEKADLVLSAASFAEGDGTVVNHEGRAQRFFQVYDPAFYDKSVTILESWRWLSAMKAGQADWGQFDQIIDEVCKTLPALEKIKDAAPDASFRVRGQKLAREPHRYSGRTAMRANISVHEPRQPQDKDSMFAFSMEGNNQPSAPRSEIPFAWAPGWNSPQAWNKFQAEIGGHLRHGDPGIRLFEKGEDSLNYFTAIPKAFKAKSEEWQIVPFYHLFGSEETSQRSPVFQKRMPSPYLKLNPADAAKLGITAGMLLILEINEQIIQLPVVLSENLTTGQIGLPMGFPDIAPILAHQYIDTLRVVEV